MARPNKQGIDYFSLDVHLDDKFKFIEIKYDLEGFAIIIKLLQKIYSIGYWYQWTEDEALLFSDEIRADYELVNNVVNEAIDRNVFDKTLYEKYKILTSKGIQKRYQEAVKRRKDVQIVEEYLVIDNNFGVNVNINSQATRVNESKSTQSKVKETKVKNTKEKSSSRSKLKFETHHMKLAELLFKNIKENNPNAKEPNLESWANTFRLMMESPKEKRLGKEIQDLILWSQQHHFWYKNILSADKLRKQFDRLLLEMKDEQKKPVKNNVIQIPNYGGDRNVDGKGNEQHSKSGRDVQLFK
ncbi:DUF4373 domain-containing protein [Oceanobacillus sp. FSL H7-0719]|uniref:DUF4373 domain-containing protein n=1 Tax=Oceanobacillus sp. FSL H7-0719 TaxID=2954507 RepID=UPI003250CA8B